MPSAGLGRNGLGHLLLFSSSQLPWLLPSPCGEDTQRMAVATVLAHPAAQEFPGLFGLAEVEAFLKLFLPVRSLAVRRKHMGMACLAPHPSM